MGVVVVAVSALVGGAGAVGTAITWRHFFSGGWSEPLELGIRTVKVTAMARGGPIGVF
jgi:hypothetical protein